ncbi:MAG: formylglycine-generating enzyme family protein, partial [Planctomycetes bacterium]|nr:formylglycine-generating enzyme family protein [Planctomycetota bacterium]
PESDLHLLTPMDFHASSSALIQMLSEGHHGVALTPDDLSVLYTWIDLNVPYHGSIFEMSQMEMNGHWAKHELPYVKMPNQSMILGCENSEQGIRMLYAKRMEVMKEAAGFVIDTEKELRDWRSQIRAHPIEPEMPSHGAFSVPQVGAQAKAQLPPAGTSKTKPPHDLAPLVLDVGLAPDITLAWIPGNARLRSNGFYMATTELSNAQYAQFDKKHDSKYIARPGKDQGSRGHEVNSDRQPVIRISQRQALTFCDWLSAKTGHNITLPSAQQWEYACRAGTETPLWFGQCECDFTTYANLADSSLKVKGRNGVAGVPFDTIHDDGAIVTTEIGSYLPNPWGLFNMHGNVSEWTRTERNGKVIASGGSWRDRPKGAIAATQRHFENYQPTLFTGFRIIVEP